MDSKETKRHRHKSHDVLRVLENKLKEARAKYNKSKTHYNYCRIQIREKAVKDYKRNMFKVVQ